MESVLYLHGQGSYVCNLKFSSIQIGTFWGVTGNSNQMLGHSGGHWDHPTVT